MINSVLYYLVQKFNMYLCMFLLFIKFILNWLLVLIIQLFYVVYVFKFYVLEKFIYNVFIIFLNIDY